MWRPCSGGSRCAGWPTGRPLAANVHPAGRAGPACGPVLPGGKAVRPESVRGFTDAAEAITTARRPAAPGIDRWGAPTSADYGGAFAPPAAATGPGSRSPCGRTQGAPRQRRVPDQALDRDQVPERRATDEQQRRAIPTAADGQWSALHPGTHGRKPAHRTDGEATARGTARAEAEGTPRGGGRAGRHLPVPRGVHRQPASADRGRSDHRDHAGRRAGRRGPDRRTREWVALAVNANAARIDRGHRARPDPGGRRAGLDPARHLPGRDVWGTRPRRCLPRPQRRDTITWHLPENWPWQDAWLSAFDATHRAPPAAAA